jgi:uncharacterized protein YbaR (Trm112 family)
MLSDELLKILCCPACKKEKDTLTCVSCNRVYEVRNGIPIMLVSDADRSDR